MATRSSTPETPPRRIDAERNRERILSAARYRRVLNAGRPLLLAAQASGETRTALTLEQILDLVAAVAKIGGDAGYREPILEAALDSLRPTKAGSRL